MVITSSKTSPIELEVFNKLFASASEEMGIVLRRSAFSPNIRERCDFSCAVFDAKGELVSQASHIPVHLGAMPETVKTVLPMFDWEDGDIVITNDPFSGGTHLPDITLIQPVFYRNELIFFLVVRAHHADVGGKFAGSMAVTTHIDEEGIRITPTKLCKKGKLDESFFKNLLSSLRNPVEREGDFRAQVASLKRGKERILELCEKYGIKKLKSVCEELKLYSERAMRKLISSLPRGEAEFVDFMEGDGISEEDIPIKATVRIKEDSVEVSFLGTHPQVKGSINAPRAVTSSAVYYVFICLLYTLGEYPINQGCFNPISIVTEKGSLVDARYPAAVAGGNVETSQRIVDVVFGALSKLVPELVPAGSCGSMNNIAIGNKKFAYYETIGGGMGASSKGHGLSGVHTHMTNTLNTPVEALEHEYPLRIEEYSIRWGTGGRGKHTGGDGLVRSYVLLEDADVTLLTERRRHAPYGLLGGENGATGQNLLVKKDGSVVKLPSKVNLHLKKGEKVIIYTPSGGGYGEPPQSVQD